MPENLVVTYRVQPWRFRDPDHSVQCSGSAAASRNVQPGPLKCDQAFRGRPSLGRWVVEGFLQAFLGLWRVLDETWAPRQANAGTRSGLAIEPLMNGQHPTTSPSDVRPSCGRCRSKSEIQHGAHHYWVTSEGIWQVPTWGQCGTAVAP